ncbi:hypothetical protein BGZ65_011140, partial [Modicella reniformis]
MIKDVLAMTGAIDSEEFAKFEAEYSLLNSGVSANNNNNGTSSRAVGGGRNSGSGNSNNGGANSGGQPMAALWADGSSEGSHGLPSPIGTVNGHMFSSARRGLDSGFDSNGSNGLLSDSKGGISEYSQWNSGFALDQAMYPSPTSSSSSRQGQMVGSTSGFLNSFFVGPDVRAATSPYLQATPNPQQLPFEYSSFGG